MGLRISSHKSLKNQRLKNRIKLMKKDKRQKFLIALKLDFVYKYVIDK